MERLSGRRQTRRGTCNHVQILALIVTCLIGLTGCGASASTTAPSAAVASIGPPITTPSSPLGSSGQRASARIVTPKPSASTGTATAFNFNVTVSNGSFNTLELDVPAGQPFTIDFRNADSDPALMHDVDIRDLNGKTIVDQKPIGGGQSVEYHYPGLKAGQYLFICSLHPEKFQTGRITVT